MSIAIHIPNTLSAFRILLAPVLLIVAWYGYHWLFLGLWLFSYFTDVLDGFIARRFGLSSELGAKLDTAADFAIYSASPLAIWWLWPDLMRQEWPFFLAIMLSILLPPVIGFIKFQRMTSYHTLLVKLSIILVVFSLVYWFLGGSPWPFRLVTAVAIIAALEQIAITLMLPEPDVDVRSVITLSQRQRN